MSLGRGERRQQGDRRRRPRGGRRPGDQPGTAPLILVAEADPGTGAVCEAVLARLRFAVARAHSVDEALKVLDVLQPDLVIADIDGVERLVAEMRRDEGIRDVPVIVVGDAPGGDEDSGLEADGYLSERFDADALVQEVRRVLRLVR